MRDLNEEARIAHELTRADNGPDPFSAAVRATRMPMIVTDPRQADNPIVFVNAAFTRLTGYAPAEIIGRNCRFLQGEHTDRDDVVRLGQAIAARTPIELDLVNYRKDGSTFWNRLLVSPVYADDGTLIYYFASQFDVTLERERVTGLERDKAQLEGEIALRTRALDASEQRYRSLFGSLDAGFAVIGLVFDPAGVATDYKFIEVNPAFTLHTGLADPTGKWRSEVIPDYEDARLISYGDVARTGTSIRFETQARGLGNRYFDVHAFRVADNDATQVAILFTDITDRRRAELTLQDLNTTLDQRVTQAIASREQAEDALRQSQKLEAIGQLTGGVAHDFNNLLTVIRSATDLLRLRDLSEDKRRRYIDAISDTADRAAKLTGQLLAFARRQSLRPETFDARLGVEAVNQMLGTLTGSRITLDQRLADAPCWINVDAAQLDTAIVNMVVNARDAMAGEGTLVITVAQVDAMPAIRAHGPTDRPFVTIAIADTGAGIPADTLQQIFEPFFTTKPVGQGTGLGLSQVFGFAKQSGGEVDVASEPGRGTTFTLYLPRVAAPAAAVAPVVIDEPPLPAGHATRVLVVEDNADVGHFAGQSLAELGYRSVYAADADEALTALASDAARFDIVFSDIVMPGMSGIDLAKQIRVAHPTLPVVLTSGYSHVLAQNGSFGFELLHKPYSVGQLSRVLRKALRWSHDDRAGTTR